MKRGHHACPFGLHGSVKVAKRGFDVTATTRQVFIWSETQVLLDERLPLCQIAANDEPFVSVGPYLAVFDERTAREELDTSRWSPNQAGAGRRGRDLTEFIDATARQLHFNRFTGVAMEASNR